MIVPRCMGACVAVSVGGDSSTTTSTATAELPAEWWLERPLSLSLYVCLSVSLCFNGHLSRWTWVRMSALWILLELRRWWW